MNKNYLKELITDPPIFWQLVLESLYVIIDVCYLFKLNSFNKLMAHEGLTSQLETNQTLSVATIILNKGGYSFLWRGATWVCLGIGMFFILSKLSKYSAFPIWCAVIKVLHLIIFIIFLVVLWNLINNPIIHAFLIVAGVGSFVMLYFYK